MRLRRLLPHMRGLDVLTSIRAVLVGVCWLSALTFLCYAATAGPSLVELAALLLGIFSGAGAFWVTLEIQRRAEHWRQEARRW